MPKAGDFTGKARQHGGDGEFFQRAHHLQQNQQVERHRRPIGDERHEGKRESERQGFGQPGVISGNFSPAAHTHHDDRQTGPQAAREPGPLSQHHRRPEQRESGGARRERRVIRPAVQFPPQLGLGMPASSQMTIERVGHQRRAEKAEKAAAKTQGGEHDQHRRARQPSRAEQIGQGRVHEGAPTGGRPACSARAQTQPCSRRASNLRSDPARSCAPKTTRARTRCFDNKFKRCGPNVMLPQ